MTALARNYSLSGLDARARSGDSDTTARQLSLRPDGDRCSLVTADGRVLFTHQGAGARRKCLRFAQELGALALTR